MLSVLNKIKHHSIQKPNPLTLQTIYNYGKHINEKKIIKQSQYLYDEIPIRIAKRISGLQTLPYNMCKLKGLQDIHDNYIITFQDLINAEYPNNIKKSYEYTNILKRLHEKHKNVEFNFANVLKTYKNNNIDELKTNEVHINKKLNEFYLSRISLRLLVGQHIEVLNSNIGEKNVGLIHKIYPETIINKSIYEAQQLLKEQYYHIPKINVEIINDTEIMHIPRHLRYIIFEILKNSMEATINFHNKNNNNIPPINITCINYEDQMTLKFSDYGGGFPKDDMKNIFSFFYSKVENHDYNPYMNHNITPISGFGHGLGLAKLYANYFGGDISIIPIEGLGTDTFVHLNCLGNKSEIFLDSADNIY